VISHCEKKEMASSSAAALPTMFAAPFGSVDWYQNQVPRSIARAGRLVVQAKIVATSPIQEFLQRWLS
jgi:hypothetical protein